MKAVRSPYFSVKGVHGAKQVNNYWSRKICLFRYCRYRHMYYEHSIKACEKIQYLGTIIFSDENT